MLNPDHNASPFNAVPAVVVLPVAAMAAIELWLSAGQSGLIGGPGAISWRSEALHRFAFSAQLFDWMLQAPGRASVEILIRFLTFPFVHASFTHMIFAAVITLALGKFVGEVFRQWAVVIVWIVSCIVAALVYSVTQVSEMPLFGGMVPAYGLMGVYTFALWMRARMRGEPAWTAFRMIGLLILLQLAFSGIGGLSGNGMTVLLAQLVPELSAFATGFLVSFLVRPGGMKATLSQLRRR